MPVLLNRISTKGGRGGQKSPKSCLRRIRTAPKRLLAAFKIKVTTTVTKNVVLGRYRRFWGDN